MVDPIPNSGQAPWLYNRNGFTPFDNMDSLDRLELEIIMQESGAPSGHSTYLQSGCDGQEH